MVRTVTVPPLPRLVRSLGRPAPWVALALLLLPVGSTAPSNSTSVRLSDLLFGVAAIATTAGLLRRGALPVLRSVPALGFLVLGAGSLVEALVASDYPDNLLGGIRFVELFLVAPVAVMAALETLADALLVLGAFLLLAVGEGCLGIVQFLTATGAGYGTSAIRAVGTFGAYDIATLAQLTGLAAVSCLAIAVVRKGRLRWIALAAAVLFLLPHAASLSRGSWIATAVAAVVVLSRGRPLRLIGTAVAGAAAAAVALPLLAMSNSQLGRRVQSLVSAKSAPDQSVTDRVQLWHAAEKMATDHPVTGVGLRGFAAHRDAYAGLSMQGSSDISFGSDFSRVALKSPHDLLLLVASEQGLVLAALYGIVLAVLLVRSLVRVARRGADGATATVALVGVGMLAYSIVDMITADLGGPGSLLVSLSLGVAGWAAADVPLVRGARRTHPAEESVTTGMLDGRVPGAALREAR